MSKQTDYLSSQTPRIQQLKITFETAKHPFAGIKPIRLLREFQAVSKSYISRIRDLHNISFEDVTRQQLGKLETLSRELHTLSQAFRDIGVRQNPFVTFEHSEEDHKSIEWITFHNYQDTYDFYLSTALPQFPHHHFYSWLCHDMIEQTRKLMEISELLMMLTNQGKANQSLHDEMINRATIVIWKFEAIIDASAEFEHQQFGEG